MSLSLVLVLAIAATFAAVNGQATAEEQGKLSPLFGVNPKDTALYSGLTFTCPGSGKVIPIEQVNDDFCDCPFVKGVTVTDEPGTGACQNGVFYCANRKFRPETLPASRVNDGVCDCCDGSDEWKEVGGKKCPSECASLGTKIYEEEKEQLEALGDALEIKRKLIVKAQKDLDKLRSELKKLKNPAALPIPRMVQPVINIKLGTDDISDEELNRVSIFEVNEGEKEEEEGNKENLPKDGDENKNEDVPIVKEDGDDDDGDDDGEGADATPKEEIHHGDRDDDNNDVDESDNDTDDFVSDSDNDSDNDGDDDDMTFLQIVGKAFKDCSKSVKKGVNKFLFGKSGRYPSFAERVRWPFRYSWAKILNVVKGEPIPKGIKKYKLGPKPKKEEREMERKNKERIREIEEILKINFGEDNCFYAIYNNCTSIQHGQYKYEVCPFKSGSQGSTSLGKWDAWKNTDSSYVMTYSKGTRCFNGVERSLTVIVECGPEYKAIEASEPAMCEYQMRIYSPCACSQAKYDSLLKDIKELEAELKE